MDRNFPIIQMKQLMEEYNSEEKKEDGEPCPIRWVSFLNSEFCFFFLFLGDLVSFIKTRLSETHGEFSRQKIIKQLNYLGVIYENRKA